MVAPTSSELRSRALALLHEGRAEQVLILMRQREHPYVLLLGTLLTAPTACSISSHQACHAAVHNVPALGLSPTAAATWLLLRSIILRVLSGHMHDMCLRLSPCRE